MSQRSRAYAWQLGKPIAQVVVERCGARSGISRLRCVEIEQQHVVRVESQWNGLQVRERPREQAGADEQQQQQRDLGDEQYLLQLQPRQAVPREHAGASILERGHQRRPRRLDGRYEPEQQAADQRQPHRDHQHRPVDAGLQRQGLIAVGEQRREQACAADRDRDPQCTADRRQHQAFSEQLTDQTKAPGADAEPHGDFALSCGRARQQQIGDIGARDRENQRDDRLQQVQRFRVPSSQRVQPAAAVSELQDRQIGTLGVVVRRRSDPLRERRRQGGLRVRERDTRPETPHDLRPVVIRTGELSVGLGIEEPVRLQRHVQAPCQPRLDAVESCRGHAGHGERQVVDEDLPAHGICRRAKAALCVARTEHGDRSRARAVVIGRQQTAGLRDQPQAGEKCARHVLGVGQFGLAVDQHVHPAGAEHREQVRQH